MSGHKLVGIISRANVIRGLAAQRMATEPVVDDRSIKASVEKALSEAGVRRAFLDVIVADGVVALWGMVEVLRRSRQFAWLQKWHRAQLKCSIILASCRRSFDRICGQNQQTSEIEIGLWFGISGCCGWVSCSLTRKRSKSDIWETDSASKPRRTARCVRHCPVNARHISSTQGALRALDRLSLRPP